MTTSATPPPELDDQNELALFRISVEEIVEKLEREGHQFEADAVRANAAANGLELHPIPQRRADQ